MYQDYIDLGFSRTDMNDSIEFKETGYSGFTLEKDYNNKIAVCASSGELEKPDLYIRKAGTDTFNIIPITIEIVRDLFS
jgi:hypothetical protein